MKLRSFRMPVALVLVLGAAACRTARSTASEEDEIRTIERSRLAALVAGNADAADAFHAEDFQLINPYGQTSTKAGYIGAIRTGRLDYVRWDPGEIMVRRYANAAVIRYQSMLEVTVNGEHAPARAHWHFDLYERRNGRWVVVWSQATFVN